MRPDLVRTHLAVGISAFAALLLGSCGGSHQEADISPADSAPEYLYVWGTVVDTAPSAPVLPDSILRRQRRGVALLTIDLRHGSPTRGQVVDAILADSAGRSAHHTEHALAPDGMLFANDFGTGRTHRFDLSVAGAPHHLGSFTTAGPFAYPHSYAQLPDGTVLATYQWQGLRQPPGGLAQLRRDGSVVRWAHAHVPGIEDAQIQPYSVEPVPALDRIVTTSTSMTDDAGVHVQIWRLSDLALLHTLEVPAAAEHAGHGPNEDPVLAHTEEHHRLPGEPRLLSDGRTVLFGTFTCGLYVLTGIDSQSPRLEFVHAFPGEDCAVPVTIQDYWIQTVPAQRAVVALDVSDPHRPREVSRLILEEPVEPHWLARDTSGEWLVLSSGSVTDPRVHLLRLQRGSGTLSRAEELSTVDLSRTIISGWGTVLVVPHGAVFSNRVRQASLIEDGK